MKVENSVKLYSLLSRVSCSATIILGLLYVSFFGGYT